MSWILSFIVYLIIIIMFFSSVNTLSNRISGSGIWYLLVSVTMGGLMLYLNSGDDDDDDYYEYY